MRIAVFYPDTESVSWGSSKGIPRTLSSMGHSVIDVPMRLSSFEGPDAPREYAFHVEQMRQAAPSPKKLKDCDAIIVSGPEYLGTWLDALYTHEEWKKIKTPKLGWYHESFAHPNVKFSLETNEKWVDEHFCPFIQDAEFLSQKHMAGERAHWLPFGVDTSIFFPSNPPISQIYPVCFIGLLYDKRKAYLDALSNHNIPPIRHGQVSVRDLSGYNQTASMRLYAEQIQRMKVFFNLPAMSEGVVSKVYEVMACGTMLITPHQSAANGADRNERQFENGKHLIYYKPVAMAELANKLQFWISDGAFRERTSIAVAGAKHVKETCSLDLRMMEMLKVLASKPAREPEKAVPNDAVPQEASSN